MFFGSIISAKFEVVACGIGAPSISYVRPWNPFATGSLYENLTMPGTVCTRLFKLLFVGRAASC